MNASFRCKDTEKLFKREGVKRFPKDIHRAALRKLAQLDAIDEVQQLRIPPGNHFEKLKGDRLGQYSIRINIQWRICFEWQNGEAINVEIVDYHE